MNIEKAIRSEIRKWISIDLDIYFIKERIKDCYYKISLGDYEDKKKAFINLHYLKIKRDYFLLKIYHNEIKKIKSNDKLLKYFESVLVAHGFDLSKI